MTAGRSAIKDAHSSFHLPSREDLEDVIKLFHLSKEQAQALEDLLQATAVDLGIHRVKLLRRPVRRDMVDNLQKFVKLFSELRQEVAQHEAELVEFLPHEALRSMAAQLCFSAISASRGKDAYPKNFRADMKAMRKRNGHAPTLQEIEERYASARADFGLTNPGPLLLHFLDTLLPPMRALLEVNRHNPGGRPILAERRYLIEGLVMAAPMILGKEAPVSTTGRFVDLCEQIAEICGLSTDGIDKVVASTVKELAEVIARFSSRPDNRRKQWFLGGLLPLLRFLTSGGTPTSPFDRSFVGISSKPPWELNVTIGARFGDNPSWENYKAHGFYAGGNATLSLPAPGLSLLGAFRRYYALGINDATYGLGHTQPGIEGAQRFKLSTNNTWNSCASYKWNAVAIDVRYQDTTLAL